MRVVERVVTAPAPADLTRVARRDDWPVVLGDLAQQLDTGRVYRRDLAAIAIALDKVLSAFRRTAR